MNAELVVQAIAEIGRCDEKSLPQALQQLASSLAYKHAAIVQASRKAGSWVPDRTVCASKEFRRACKAVLKVVCESPDPVRMFTTTSAVDFTKSIEETSTYSAAGIHLEEHCTPDSKLVLMLVSDVPSTTLSDMEKRLLSTVGTLVSKVLEKKPEPDPERELGPDVSDEIGMVSHDLRNPMGTILGYTEMLLQSKAGETLQEDQKMVLGKIRDSSLFVLNMLGELMDSAAIESGKVRIEAFPYDIASPIKSSVDRCRMAAGKKQISIDADLPAEPLRPLVDLGKIGRVIDNLITNAIKFSRPGTTITVGAKRDGDEARIFVRDQGQGIREEEIALLFKKFSRTSTRSTAGEKSSGLGLYIVRALIKLHGGSVHVESEWEKGSTFSFTLPLSKE